MKAVRERSFILWSCAAVLASVFLAWPAWAQEKGIKLRYANYFSPMHPISQLSQAWAKEVEKRTEGRVRITYFAGSTLTPPTQTYDSVVKGIADIGQALPAWSPNRFPLTEVLALPLGYTSGYQATKLANEYFRRFHPKEFDDSKIMYFHASGPVIFHTRKAITGVDGIKGLRIRANAELDGIVKAVGGAPVNLPITESYDGLNKGLLDGLLLPMDVLKGWRFGEVTKTTLDIAAVASSVSHYVVMNKDKWNTISKIDQQTIEKINDEWIEKHGKLWTDLDKEAREFAIQKGSKIIKATKDEEAKTAEKMKPLLAAYVKDKKGRGLPADEVLKFCQDYIKVHP